MNDELNQEPIDRQEPEAKTPDTSITPTKSPRPLKLKYRRVADRYLVNGMNATEAYNHIFKPENPEKSHSFAYRIVALPAVREYIEKRLTELNEVNYHPEAIKSALSNKAVSAKRDSDSIRALELMAKISGLLTENVNNTQVNFVTDEIMQLAKKRILSKGSQTIEPEVLTAKPSEPFTAHNAHYRTLDEDKVQTDGELVQEKDRPRGEGMADPPPMPESNSNTSP